MLLLLKTISFLFNLIPPSLYTPLSLALGSIIYRADRKRKKIARENLDLAYGERLPDGEKERITRAVFNNLALMFFEFMRMPWLKKETVDRYIRCDGLENLERALKKGNGVIIITAHYGNWELIAAYLGLKGFTLDIVVRDLDSPSMDAFVRWARTRAGNVIVPKNRSMRTLLKRLKENAVVGILLDQNVAHVEGVFVPFFGVPACTNKGTALMAASSGAAAIPVFISREGMGHRLVIGNEIPLSLTGNKEKDAIENTERFTRAIEETIRKKPDEWFWVHRRWKTRPPGEKKPDARQVDTRQT